MDIPQNLSDPPNENMPYIFSGCHGIERPALPVGQGVDGPPLGDRRPPRGLALVVANFAVFSALSGGGRGS